MNKDWENIYTSTQLQQVEIMKAILAQNEIPSVIVNKQDSLSYTNLQTRIIGFCRGLVGLVGIMPRFMAFLRAVRYKFIGGIELFVERDNVLRVLQITNKSAGE